MSAAHSPIRFFVDFDGTITKSDVIDRILETFADPSWKKIEAEWAAGEIGSRECLSRQMNLVRATPEAFDRLVDSIEVDEHFVDFLKKAAELDVPVTIVSDGIGQVINLVLRRVLAAEPALLRATPVFANTIRWDESGPRLVFAGDMCAHACGNCKERVIRAHSGPGDHIAFVGDGLSDRFAARVSSLTFAKGRLADFCETNDIPYQRYSDFSEIEKWLIHKRGQECVTPKKNF